LNPIISIYFPKNRTKHVIALKLQRFLEQHEFSDTRKKILEAGNIFKNTCCVNFFKNFLTKNTWCIWNHVVPGIFAYNKLKEVFWKKKLVKSYSIMNEFSLRKYLTFHPNSALQCWMILCAMNSFFQYYTFKFTLLFYFTIYLNLKLKGTYIIYIYENNTTWRNYKIFVIKMNIISCLSTKKHKFLLCQ